MKTLVTRSLWSAVVCSLVSAPAWAQDSPSSQEVRPAITSFWGDTGLWFVPTAEVLKPGGWAFGAYRTELDFKQGSTDVVVLPRNARDRCRQSHGDLCRHSRRDGGRSRHASSLRACKHRHRAASSTNIRWSERNGRAVTSEMCTSGAKVNLLSEHRRQPMAMALRGTVKLPTAGEDNVGTGQFDYFADFVMQQGNQWQRRVGRLRGLCNARGPRPA